MLVQVQIGGKTIYLSVDFEPDITLSTTLYNRPNSHQADDKRLPLLDRNMHFFADIWSAEEVACWNDTNKNED
jgi:hypothetical protein